MSRLCALKWCTILLNEFVPEHLERRDFASPQDLPSAQRLDEQLAKAARMLQQAP
jgi:hypothetical protein